MEKKSVPGENQVWGREKKEKREREREDFPMFRQSELDSLRTKVGPHNESYAWVPKSEFFVEALRDRSCWEKWVP